MLLHETVSRIAERRPQAPAIVSCDEHVTYGQLDDSGNGSRGCWWRRGAGKGTASAFWRPSPFRRSRGFSER
jgi:hypothetical protein